MSTARSPAPGRRLPRRSPLQSLTASQLLVAYRSGRAQPTEAIEAWLARIAAREPLTRAWAWHDPQAVREQWPAGRAHEASRPLSGLGIGVKDIIDVAGMPTACGSQLPAEQSPRDADAVARLREAGAVLLGKTVTAEFAFTHPGPTTHPHNPSRTPRGSSSGSAAAVAAGMVPLALGTQTGGSIIRPSAYCGVVGFKPSFGCLSMRGVRPLAHSLDTLGVHARCVSDVQHLMRVLDPAWRECPASEEPAAQNAPTIAYFPGPLADQAEPAMVQRLEHSAARLKAAGWRVEPLSLPERLVWRMNEANRTILRREGARSLAPLDRAYPNRLARATRELIQAGLAIAEPQYQEALHEVGEARRAYAQATQGVAALLTFSAPGQAPLRTEGTGSSVFNQAWTALGVPCLNLPAGTSPIGLPLGVQLVGRLGEDARLLAVARLVEACFAPPLSTTASTAFSPAP